MQVKKRPYKHWVSKGIMDGYYYHFKTFKVYWAYRWYIAKEIDRNGIKTLGMSGVPSIYYTNYAAQYE